MHAASVNPEPGSNSLKNCISFLTKVASSKLIPFSELFYLSFFFYFVLSFSKFLTRFLYTFQCFKEISLLFNFQWSKRCHTSERPLPSSRQPVYSTTLYRVCQAVFWKNIRFFCRNSIFQEINFNAICWFFENLFKNILYCHRKARQGFYKTYTRGRFAKAYLS